MNHILIALGLAILCNFALASAEPLTFEHWLEEPITVEVSFDGRRPTALGSSPPMKEGVLANICQSIVGMLKRIFGFN